MQSELRPPKIKLRHKLIFAQVAVTLTAVLVAEGGALVILGLLTRQPTFTLFSWTLHVALVSAGAVLVGLVLGVLASHWVARRLRRALDISGAWMRGNLSLRIADRTRDDLGLLSTQLDLLAEHLAEDEQDLAELRERNARLTDQVRALAVVEERNRLARELHDSVKQNLFSLAMTASGIRARFEAQRDVPADLIEMVREVETTAQAAQREMTRLIEDLRPSTLQDQGLAEALNDYTLLFGAREHLLIYLDVQGNDALLPPPVLEALYRVTQEALHNVARHARATRVDVHLRCIPEHVSLTIEDNGVGFDLSQAHGGLGLQNMQERMLEVGGVLTIESQTGIGTLVTAEAALPHPLGTRMEIVKVEKDLPIPTIENWTWLGQRLVIPVGQTWPWLPADQVHLRRPLVDPTDEPLTIKHVSGVLGLGRSYSLQPGPHRVRIHHTWSGYEWENRGASWALRTISRLGGRAVLMRNGQPLAAMQYQGRLMNTWTEIVYDGRGYRLSYVKDRASVYVLTDESGDELLTIQDGAILQIGLNRALPLSLLVMTAMRVAEETVPTSVAQPIKTEKERSDEQ